MHLASEKDVERQGKAAGQAVCRRANNNNQHSNSYTKNKLNFNSTNSKWNYYYNFNMNSAKPKFNIASSTAVNFWKGGNGNKFKINNFIKKIATIKKVQKFVQIILWG